MPKPITVSVDVPQKRESVWEFLDALPNHAGFTDHFLTDWEFSGPESGVGAKAKVRAEALGVTDTVEIEVVKVEAPRLSVERNRAEKAGRVAQGTYTLDELDGGGTRVSFEYRWLETPVADKLLGPVARSVIRRVNAKAMDRLADRLASIPV
jgi:hypothetical protein